MYVFFSRFPMSCVYFGSSWRARNLNKIIISLISERGASIRVIGTGHYFPVACSLARRRSRAESRPFGKDARVNNIMYTRELGEINYS